MSESATVLLSREDLSGFLVMQRSDRAGRTRYYVKHDDGESTWERITDLEFRLMRDKGARDFDR